MNRAGRWTAFAPALMLAAMLAGCLEGPTSVDPTEPHLVASVTGVIQETISTSDARAHEGSGLLLEFSQASVGARHLIRLTGTSHPVPVRGTFPIGRPGTERGASFEALYEVTYLGSGARHAFVATRGTLVVREVTDDRIDGDLDFEAVGITVGGSVRVQGRFSAGR